MRALAHPLQILALAATLTACAPSAHAPDSNPTATNSPVATAGIATPQSRDGERPTSDVQPSTVVSRGNTSRRMVALTFDAGSDAVFTGEILDVLRRENVRATFSVTGLWAERNRDLLLAITAAGHQAINHSYGHASFTGASTGAAALTAEQRALELSRTEGTVYHLSQRSTRPYFRPPYGDIDASVQRDAAAAGYGTIVLWTVDTLGWNQASVDAIVERALAKAEPGAIYAMHVGSESQDAVALPRIIDGLREQGYTFGAIEEILAP